MLIYFGDNQAFLFFHDYAWKSCIWVAFFHAMSLPSFLVFLSFFLSFLICWYRVQYSFSVLYSHETTFNTQVENTSKHGMYNVPSGVQTWDLSNSILYLNFRGLIPISHHGGNFLSFFLSFPSHLKTGWLNTDHHVQ